MVTHAKKSVVPLLPREEVFCHEYMVDVDAEAAAQRAGYKAAGYGKDILKKPRVKLRIAELINARNDRLKMQGEGDKILEELACICHSDIGDIPMLREIAEKIPAHARKAISSIKIKRYKEGKGEDAKDVELVEFKFWPKDVAIDKMMRHLGILDNNPNVTLNVKINQKVHQSFRDVIADPGNRGRLLELAYQAVSTDDNAAKPLPPEDGDGTECAGHP